MSKKHTSLGIAFAYIVCASLLLFSVGKYVFGFPLNFQFIQSTVLEDPKEENCMNLVAPVCANNKTYPNECLAKRDGMQNYTKGACPVVENTTSSTVSDSDQCDTRHEPVCGDDGKTYDSACWASRAKVTIVSYGECEDDSSGDSSNNAMISENISSENKSISQPIPVSSVETSRKNSPESASSTIKNANGNKLEKKETDQLPEISQLPSESDHPSGEDKLSSYDEKKYHKYKNTSVGYSFALPKNTSYQGFGARDGAVHTMGVSVSGAGVDSFESADVKVYYYKKPPENPPSDNLVRLDNGDVVYISGVSANANTENIIKTIKESVEK